ncbi:MAG TPA: glycoside hydrolase family 9 protein, partial [Polyangiaceae bacterium]|nr:glycoside hydrolase family 9 protein [Polyangiaceae bacterium]
FSSVTAPGEYYVLDESQNVRSSVFSISDGAYATVLEQAIRMLYYQRDGTAKPAMYAGAGWADTMEHPQDAQCVTWDTMASPRDLLGGWFDAGDQNKYTNWGAVDVIGLLRAYRENQGAFADDYGIPESGNGVPDVLDEAKWEIDWLLRMQGTDGGLLSIVGHQGASPPSADTSPCLYGPETTSASYSGAAVFAFASVIFAPIDSTYASQLETAAQSAWAWAQANPNVTFDNTGKVGAGDQELDTGYGLPMRELEAALYLFEATGEPTYRQYFDANYTNAHMFTYGNYADMFEGEPQETLLDYTLASGATPSVVQAIQSAYKAGMQGANNVPAQQGNKDPYLAYIYTYVWGSNANRAVQGTMYYDLVSYGIDTSPSDDASKYAERYVHYFHGVNPLSLAYLSNMGDYGAQTSVTCFFHSWFTHSSALWNQIGVSTYGPPPGYLPGGPNPGYALDSCCTSTTDSCSTQAGCASTPSPPAGQPSQKSYAQFNEDWPVDSWQVTEPDDGYQTSYIRLLSKFVD